MHGFSPKVANSLASTLPLIESPPCPPQWGPMPFAVFTAMAGGNVPLEGDKGGEAVFGSRPSFETGFQKHFIAFPLDV